MLRIERAFSLGQQFFTVPSVFGVNAERNAHIPHTIRQVGVHCESGKKNFWYPLSGEISISIVIENRNVAEFMRIPANVELFSGVWNVGFFSPVLHVCSWIASKFNGASVGHAIGIYGRSVTKWCESWAALTYGTIRINNAQEAEEKLNFNGVPARNRHRGGPSIAVRREKTSMAIACEIEAGQTS